MEMATVSVNACAWCGGPVEKEMVDSKTGASFCSEACAMQHFEGKEKKKCAGCGKTLSGPHTELNLNRDGDEVSEGDGLVCCDSDECRNATLAQVKGHRVRYWSRVTGYYQEVGSWNGGKRQEFDDRHRITV